MNTWKLSSVRIHGYFTTLRANFLVQVHYIYMWKSYFLEDHWNLKSATIYNQILQPPAGGWESDWPVEEEDFRSLQPASSVGYSRSKSNNASWNDIYT